MKIKNPTPAGALLAAVAIVISLTIVPAALAGKSGGSGGSSKGSGSGGGTVSGPVMVVDNNGDGSPNFGDTITFNVSSTASFPSVQLACSQNGSVVYTATRGFYPTYAWSDNYLLEGGYWSGGAASCTATLYTTSKNGSNVTLATLNFVANG